MKPKNKISFEIKEKYEGGPIELVPYVDGSNFADTVAAFEQLSGFRPAGAYGGLIPSYFNYGPLEKYFLGRADNYWKKKGGIYILGCQCGEVGCWPLFCKVTVESESVIWDRFKQPHRLDRDYSGFGPFVFDLVDYKREVASCVVELGNASSEN